MTYADYINSPVNTDPEPYHPDKVRTWPKEEQEAYQRKIQPMIDAAARAEEIHNLDDLETIAALDKMTAIQETYPYAYRAAWILFLNNPIDRAERRAAQGWKRLAEVMGQTMYRPIWQRETPPETMDDERWQTLAALDRITEYELMAQLD